MKTISSLVIALLCHSVFAAYRVGDTMKNDCWDNEVPKKICMDDYKDRVRVLIYSAGWCLPCNREARELAKVKEFDKKPVTFISISAEGWKGGSKPDEAFLKEWKAKHSITYETVGKHRDFGKDFADSGAVPFVVVVEKSGKVQWTETGPKHDDILKQIRKALSP